MLSEKVVIITGWGTGIGNAIGLQMAKNGAKVAIVSRTCSHLEPAAAEFMVLGLPVLPTEMDICSPFFTSEHTYKAGES